MSALPWLVIHGAAVWKAALALFLLAGLAFAALRPRIAARREARAARRRIGPPVPLRGAWPETRVTLEGRLEGDPGSSLRTEGAVSARTGRLALRVGESTVRLDGLVEVAVGSREAWPGRVLAGVVGPASRSLGPGDLVVVSGVLGEEASDEKPSYRDGSKHWTLGGALVAAHTGAPRVSGPSALVRVPPVLVAGALFLGAFWAAGAIAMAAARDELAAHAAGTSTRPLQVALMAAATPFHRDAALAAIVSALDARAEPDLAALEARAAFHELRGDRAEVAEMWIAHGEPERGAALAERADRLVLAAHGWYAAGAFERAADTWWRASAHSTVDELRFGLGVQILGGQLDRAARTADRLAAALRAHPADNDRLRRLYAARAEVVECLALSLDARRGGAEAWTRLHAPRSEPLLPACAALRVDLFEGPARLQAIRLLPPLARDHHDVPRAWLTLLAAEADPASGEEIERPFESAAEVVAIPNGEPVARMIPGVERHLAEALLQRPPSADRKRPRWTPAWVSASAAVFAFLSGDAAGARALARATTAAYAPLSAARFSYLSPSSEELEAVIALPDDRRAALAQMGSGRETGDFLHGLVDVIVERDAGPMLSALGRRPPPDLDEKQAWTFAARGDGEALARWMRRPLSQPGTFLRLGAPQLRTGREPLLRAVLHGHRALPGFRPTEEVVHLANRTAAAEALAPDAALAAPLRERTRRFREAVLRRETAVPLAVLERL